MPDTDTVTALRVLSEAFVNLARSIDTKASGHNEGLADGLLHASDLADAMIQQIQIDVPKQGFVVPHPTNPETGTVQWVTTRREIERYQELVRAKDPATMEKRRAAAVAAWPSLPPDYRRQMWPLLSAEEQRRVTALIDGSVCLPKSPNLENKAALVDGQVSETLSEEGGPDGR